MSDFSLNKLLDTKSLYVNVNTDDNSSSENLLNCAITQKKEECYKTKFKLNPNATEFVPSDQTKDSKDSKKEESETSDVGFFSYFSRMFF
jgi:hypothetical protein